MPKEDLLEIFYEKYTTKEETMYRLPINTDIEKFWPSELALRMKNATVLPLLSFDGKPYFYNKTERFVRAADTITTMARNCSEASVFSEFSDCCIIDEAYYSSIIEGAYSTKENARKLIESGNKPLNKDELMILNNYRTLTFVLDHLDYPINEEIILKIGELVTEGTLDENIKQGYRDGPVYVVSHTGQTVYTAPEAAYIKPMMNSLIAYINDPKVHPIEKAVITHVYFVTVHPFFDGNGRTSRALTYMILLKYGYDFFRMVPISGILSEKRSKYYKALSSCHNTENGYDFTYFTDFYTGLLSDTLVSVKDRLSAFDAYKRLSEISGSNINDRILKGASWMAKNDVKCITSEKWRSKFGVSFETARKDLMTLESYGYLKKRTEGRKIFFYLKHE